MKARTGATAARLELAGRAAALRAEGLGYREIGKALKVSRAYASDLVLDPDGSRARARKDSYRRPCPRCGTLMDGSNGPNRPPSLCAQCAIETAEQVWTREAIVQVFREFERRVGRPPSATDTLVLFPSQRARFSAERLEEARHALAVGPALPAPATVAARFGSWTAALAASGFPPTPNGGAAHRVHSPLYVRLVALLGERGPMTTAELEDEMGPQNWRRLLEKFDQAGAVPLDRAGHTFVYRLAERQPTTKGDTMRDYKVLWQNEGHWDEIGTARALSAELAVEQVAQCEGDYVAVPAMLRRPLQVGRVTKLGVVPAPAPA